MKRNGERMEEKRQIKNEIDVNIPALIGLIIGAIVGFFGGRLTLLLAYYTFPLMVPLQAFSETVLKVKFAEACTNLLSCNYLILIVIYYAFCGFSIGWFIEKIRKRSYSSYGLGLVIMFGIYLIMGIICYLVPRQHPLPVGLVVVFVLAPLILIILSTLIGLSFVLIEKLITKKEEYVK